MDRCRQDGIIERLAHDGDDCPPRGRRQPLAWLPLGWAFAVAPASAGNSGIIYPRSRRISTRAQNQPRFLQAGSSAGNPVPDYLFHYPHVVEAVALPKAASRWDGP